MRVSLMLSESDAKRIDALKKRLGVATRVDVVRIGLGLLERHTERALRMKTWERAVRLVAPTSGVALADFRRHGRLHRAD